MLMIFGVSLLIINTVRSRRHGAMAGNNPWGASTLEWATTSPPPQCNFFAPPTVSSRDPLWEDPPDQAVVIGLRGDKRDVLVTSVMDAEPDHRMIFPDRSIWPLWTALATTALFVGSIFTPWAVVIGAIPVFVAMTGWFWPKQPAEGGTQSWPFNHRTLPMPNEGPAGPRP